MKQHVDQYLERLRVDGSLREFNSEYRRRRVDAKAQGRGFMSYSAALARLRNGVVTKISDRNKVMPTPSLFDDVFGR